MSDSLNVGRLLFAISFVTYEIWAFRHNKSISHKLLPSISIVILGMFIVVLTPFVGSMGYFIIFAILMIELSFIAAMIVILLEICISLINANRSITRVLILTGVFILLLVVYYLGERVF